MTSGYTDAMAPFALGLLTEWEGKPAHSALAAVWTVALFEDLVIYRQEVKRQGDANFCG